MLDNTLNSLRQSQRVARIAKHTMFSLFVDCVFISGCQLRVCFLKGQLFAQFGVARCNLKCGFPDQANHVSGQINTCEGLDKRTVLSQRPCACLHSVYMLEGRSANIIIYIIISSTHPSMLSRIVDIEELARVWKIFELHAGFI